MPFRFLITRVLLNPNNGQPILTPCESDMTEAPNYNSAAAEAESRWPGEHFSVTKIGRVHAAGATDVLPLTSGAGN